MTMNAEGMLALRGDQKVLQLGYKTLTYYVTHAVIFLDIFLCNINAYFHFLLSAVYTRKIEFSVLILSDHAFTAIFSDSPTINQVP